MDPMIVVPYLYVFLIALVATRGMVQLGIQDVPTYRSSHVHPTPRAGGMGIIVALLVSPFLGVVWPPLELMHLWPLAFGLAILVLTSIWDDIRPLAAHFKFLAQFCVFAGAIGSGVIPPDVVSAWLVMGAALLLFMNALNFMDGLNGLVSITSAVAALILASLLYVMMPDIGASGLWIPSLLALAAASLGFALWNFPKAHIFLGDVGSQFLGAFWGLLIFILAPEGMPLVIIPLLFFHFIWDVGWTLLKRAGRGEKLWQAHREHLYQRLHQSGFSHTQVTGISVLMTLFHGALAWGLLYTSLESDGWVQSFWVLPAIVGQMLYTRWVMRRGERLA